jgi:hypothetical protein
MATQSNDWRIPEWCRVEGYQAFDRGGWQFRVGLQCKDADVKVFDIPQNLLTAPGRSTRLDMTKLQLLQVLHEQITAALAKAILEQE